MCKAPLITISKQSFRSNNDLFFVDDMGELDDYEDYNDYYDEHDDYYDYTTSDEYDETSDDETCGDSDEYDETSEEETSQSDSDEYDETSDDSNSYFSYSSEDKETETSDTDIEFDNTIIGYDYSQDLRFTDNIMMCVIDYLQIIGEYIEYINDGDNDDLSLCSVESDCSYINSLICFVIDHCKLLISRFDKEDLSWNTPFHSYSNDDIYNFKILINKFIRIFNYLRNELFQI